MPSGGIVPRTGTREEFTSCSSTSRSILTLADSGYDELVDYDYN